MGRRIIATEDSFVERKTAGDNKRWIPALVAFANSAPIGFPCVLFIGAKDDGTLEANVGVESLQKSFTKRQAKYFRRYRIPARYSGAKVESVSP